MSRPDPKTHEVFTIKGDPTSGVSLGADLTKGAIGHPDIYYKDRICTADVYLADGQLSIHMYCPRCLNSIWIKSTEKQVSYDAATNTLSVERIRCPWELPIPQGGRRRRMFGLALCRWQVVIDNNEAVDD